MSCCLTRAELQGAPKDLAALIPVNKYHVYAIGSQECMRSIAKSVVRPSKNAWEVRGVAGPAGVLCGRVPSAAASFALTVTIVALLQRRLRKHLGHAYVMVTG